MTSPAIFIVEDEALIAMELEGRLEQLDYRVCGHVGSGEEAVSKVADIHPDLVLMDINLAGAMNGIEAAEQIRQHYDIPVVFLSAFSHNDLLQQAAHAEPYGYLLKPFEERTLHATITMALHRHQKERERTELTRELQHILFQIRDLCGALPSQAVVRPPAV